jgi:hypothetical protein
MAQVDLISNKLDNINNIINTHNGKLRKIQDNIRAMISNHTAHDETDKAEITRLNNELKDLQEKHLSDTQKTKEEFDELLQEQIDKLAEINEIQEKRNQNSLKLIGSIESALGESTATVDTIIKETETEIKKPSSVVTSNLPNPPQQQPTTGGKSSKRKKYKKNKLRKTQRKRHK